MPTVPFEVPGLKFTLPADSDLSAGQYLALVCDANGDAARAGAGVAIVGVQQNKPDAAGKATDIVANGITKAIAGSTGVTAGDDVMVEAGGDFVAATATNTAVGIALTSAAAGEVFSLLLGNQGNHA